EPRRVGTPSTDGCAPRRLRRRVVAEQPPDRLHVATGRGVAGRVAHERRRLEPTQAHQPAQVERTVPGLVPGRAAHRLPVHQDGGQQRRRLRDGRRRSSSSQSEPDRGDQRTAGVLGTRGPGAGIHQQRPGQRRGRRDQRRRDRRHRLEPQSRPRQLACLEAAPLSSAPPPVSAAPPPVIYALRIPAILLALAIVLLAWRASRRGRAARTTLLFSVGVAAAVTAVAISPSIVYTIRDQVGIADNPLSGLVVALVIVAAVQMVVLLWVLVRLDANRRVLDDTFAAVAMQSL